MKKSLIMIAIFVGMASMSTLAAHAEEPAPSASDQQTYNALMKQHRTSVATIKSLTKQINELKSGAQACASKNQSSVSDAKAQERAPSDATATGAGAAKSGSTTYVPVMNGMQGIGSRTDTLDP